MDNTGHRLATRSSLWTWSDNFRPYMGLCRMGGAMGLGGCEVELLRSSYFSRAIPGDVD